MRLAAVLASLTFAATQQAPAADNPPGPATPSQASPSVQAAPAAVSEDLPAAVRASAATATTDSPVSANATSATASSADHADTDSDAASLEKRLHARGFAPRLQNGEKVFCRREEVLGTRLGGALHCMTLAEARVGEQQMQRDEELLRQRVMQSCIRSGMQGGKEVVNCGN